MISVILYGRNDNYGYNLHKRAALSLNCIAEVLTGADDEILFVDYNTPDDFPTFLEAIRDTLTAPARRLLRIFRVRPTQHAVFSDRTRLVVLEPHARNVALRRSNPKNRWVLSTNTDMIFVPRKARSLTEIAAEQTDGFFHLPRFELPETLWEELDRMDPAGVIASVARLGWDLHLNEIVYGAPAIVYDAPGDFQLMRRADLFRINGFDEGMLQGWHVDSNMARRLGLLYGAPGTLVDDLFGYHCDHTRQVTPLHGPDKTENDPGRFVNGVAEPGLPEQAATWGLANVPVEEIRLESGPSAYLRALQTVIAEPMSAPASASYSPEGYDCVGYDTRHVLPFLTDAVSSFRRDIALGWMGVSAELLEGFAAAWRALGFTGGILVADDMVLPSRAAGSACVVADWDQVAGRPDLFVIDFGPGLRSRDADRRGQDASLAARRVAFRFHQLVEIEQARGAALGAAAMRRVIVVNAVHSRFESLVRSHIAAAAAPIATRLRQGFVRPLVTAAVDLLPRLSIAGAGKRVDGEIQVMPGMRGCAFYGPYIDVCPGTYQVRLQLSGHSTANSAETEVMALEVVSSDMYLAHQPITGLALARGEVPLTFSVSAPVSYYAMSLMLEIRLMTTGSAVARISKVLLERAKTADAGAAEAFDWLRLMFIGSAGVPSAAKERLRMLLGRRPGRVGEWPREPGDAGVLARRRAGYVIFGPHCCLTPGDYRLAVALGGPGTRARSAAGGRIVIDVCGTDGIVLAQREVVSNQLEGPEEQLFFTVPDRLDNDGAPIRFEFRVWSDGRARFVIRSVRVTALKLLPIDTSPRANRHTELAA